MGRGPSDLLVVAEESHLSVGQSWGLVMFFLRYHASSSGIINAIIVHPHLTLMLMWRFITRSVRCGWCVAEP